VAVVVKVVELAWVDWGQAESGKDQAEAA